MPPSPLSDVLSRLAMAAQAAGVAVPALLAVGKRQPAGALARLYSEGQKAFGENYVQEALAKQAALTECAIEWHLIGHLQSNKAAEAAAHFDWVQTVDRPKLVGALAAGRPPGRPPLNVLVQVNIDGEPGKSGCAPEAAAALCAAIAAEPRLQLRGLMAIPAPDPDPGVRRAAFRAMRSLFDTLKVTHPGMDTLSMGMSEDAELAVAEGSTMVRIGTALFGPRH